jgi:hypothetical protein
MIRLGTPGPSEHNTHLIEDEEERRARRLLLVRHIRMPAGPVGPLCNVSAKTLVQPIPVLAVPVHDMKLWEAFHVPRRRMPLDGPKVARNLNLPLGSEVLEVLVAEQEDLALGCVERKFVETVVGELGNLDTPNFCAKVRAEVLDLGVGVEEVGLGLVGKEALVGEF